MLADKLFRQFAFINQRIFVQCLLRNPIQPGKVSGHADIHEKLRNVLFFLRRLGLVETENGILKVTPKGMYPVSVMMREFFAALNGLREYCIEKQV